MEKGVIAKGQILTETNGQRWIVGSFIGLSGSAESYEAASFDDKEVTDYPLILRIMLQGDEPLPNGIQFYLDHAKPDDLDKWKRLKQLLHLGVPVLLGADSLKINDQNYKFMVTERHGKDLWSLFLEHDKKFEVHTVYKITLQIMNVLKYIHSKSYVHGDIKASNIVVDVATQNQIYLLNDQLAFHPDETCNDAVVLLSRDAQMRDTTERGDMEMLFYNLVQWLGIELPWKKNFKDPSLVLKEKRDAFADVDKFLQSWSKKVTIPIEVCEYMKLLATMDTDDLPKYSDFKRILANGLRKLYHVPTGNLEFSISSLPIVEQIAEGFNPVNKPQKRYKDQSIIPGIGISSSKLAKIISENCRHEGEVRLRDTGPGSLIDIVFRLASRKKSETMQKKIANAWDKDITGLKTMTKELWEEKALKTKRSTTNKATPTEMCNLTSRRKSNTILQSRLANAWETEDTAGLKNTLKREQDLRANEITNEAASTENEHEERSQDLTITAAVPASENTDGLNHSSPGSSNSQSRCEVVSPVGMPPNEHTAAPDLSNTSPPNVRQTANSPSTSRFCEVQSSPIQPTTTSGYSSHGSIQDGFFDTEHYQSPEVVVVEVKREANIADAQVIECRRSESTSSESWHDKYNMLDAWLKMKEQNFDAFGSIPSEPQQVAEQVQQVRVLLDEFYSSLRLRKMKNAKLPSLSTDAQELEPLLEQIEYRWWDVQARLEKRGKQLGDAYREKLRDALQVVSNDLDKLSLDNDPEDQQLSKIEILFGQLEDLQRTLLANVTTVTEQLCQAVKVPAYTSDLRVQLRSVNNLYTNLQQKIAVKQAEVESSLSDGRQFDDSCKEIHVWLDKELENVLEKPLVSTDRTTLQQQHKYYKLEHQSVMKREAEVMELLEMGRRRVRPQNSTQQRYLESIKPLWDRLIKQILDIVKKLETCAEICDKFYQTQDLLLRWLSEIERKLESVNPASLDDIGEQLKELYALRDETREKSGEFEQYDHLGHTFISICDADKDEVVKNELSVMKDRWAKLNNDLLNHLQSFEDTDKHFADFNKSLLDLQQKIEQLEKKHNALETAAKDSQFLHLIEELRMQTVSLQEPLNSARQQAGDLVLQFRKQRLSDASHQVDGVNYLDVRIEKLKAKFDYICKEILGQEHTRSVEEIQKNKPLEGPSRDSSREESTNKSHSERRQSRSSKKNSESPSRNRRSRSKDTVSSPPRSISDSSRSHKSHKYNDSRPNSDLNPSKPKRFRNSTDLEDYRLPRYDKARQNTSHYRNRYSDSSPWRSSTHQHCWSKPHFEWRPMSRQAHSSGTFRNFNRRDRAQSLSHCDLWYRRDVYGWSSQSPLENPVWNYYQNQPVRENFRENSAYRQTTTTRNSESNVAEDEMNEKYAKLDRRGEDQPTRQERYQQKE